MCGLAIPGENGLHQKALVKRLIKQLVLVPEMQLNKAVSFGFD